MKNVNTKKGNLVIGLYEKILNEHCVLYKGAPDARYTDGYFLFAATWHGYVATGTYGKLIAHSRTLEGLIKISELVKDPHIGGVLDDSCISEQKDV